MAKTKNTIKTIASGSAPKPSKKKTKKQKIEKKVVEPVLDLVEEVKEEANEVVVKTNVSLRRWQVLLGAAAVTCALLVIIL